MEIAMELRRDDATATATGVQTHQTRPCNLKLDFLKLLHPTEKFFSFLFFFFFPLFSIRTFFFFLYSFAEPVERRVETKLNLVSKFDQGVGSGRRGSL